MKPHLFSTAVVLVLASSASAVHHKPDFDGDGFADLPISSPGETINAQGDAGGVQIIYGSSSGLRANGDQFFSRGTTDIEDDPGIDDSFGFAIAWGDFDGDDFSDLAIGVPFDDVNGVMDAGAVHVLYGSSQGLRANGNQLWHRDVPSTFNELQISGEFGFALAVGDFNHDGRDDLAIGVPGQDIDGTAAAGEVHVLFGSPSGLSASGDQIFNRPLLNVTNETIDPNDRFGDTLATGDFDGDNRDDLAVGAPFDDVNNVLNAGSAYVIYGSLSGLTTNNATRWHQNRSGILDASAMSEFFGFSLASGDFDDDGRDDLAIGVPHESIGGVQGGAVAVLYGTSNGLDDAGDQLWHQDSPSVRDSMQDGDVFGVSVAAGDFNGDGRDDLAIGVQFEDVSGEQNTGAVNVLYGGSNGLQAGNDDYWHQDSDGILDECEEFENLGTFLLAADFDDDGRDDLAIGVHLQDINAASNAGAVHAIYGHSSGLRSNGNQFWHQDVTGINNVAGTGDNFGFAKNLD